MRSRPPILLVHGTDDPMVPYESMAEAETALKAVGVPVETLTCPGIGHSIDGDGLAARRPVPAARAQPGLDDGIVETGFDAVACMLGGIPIGAALDLAEHLAVAVDEKAGRQPARP